jgi:RNA polymerase sigma factor (sigma-70 family)
MNGSHPADLPRDVIERALDGEPAAFRKLYESYDPTVRWAVGLRVYRWPKLVPELDDIVQDVWYELTRHACKRLRYHDRDRGVPFRRFLAYITTRLGWRLAKRRLGHAEAETSEAMELVEGDDWGFVLEMMHADFLDRLVELVKVRLDETDRRLFEEHYVWGDKLKDVGARLGLNENATYKRNERLPGKLQRLAEELLGKPKHGSPELVAAILATLVGLAQGELSPGGDPGSSPMQRSEVGHE